MRSADRPRVATAIQMSRSVMMPATRPSSLTTGSAPQSPSHISFTASARFVSGRQVFTSLVITSRTLMALAPFLSHVSDVAYHGRPRRSFVGIRHRLLLAQVTVIEAADELQPSALHIPDIRPCPLGIRGRVRFGFGVGRTGQ